MKKLALGLTLSFIIISGIVALNISNKSEKMYTPRSDNKELIVEKSIHGAAEWQSRRRTNLLTGEIDIRDIDNALKQIAVLKKVKTDNQLNWIELGPTNIGGRCRSIIFDKTNPNIMYAGGVSGGLWKSTTSGNSWTQVKYAGDAESDDVPNLNIGCICQDAGGTIYFGTGEGFYMGYGTGSRGFEGAGIWKSTDGEVFSRIESTWSTSESKSTFVYVNKIVAHPTIAGKLFAATKRGIQMSDDGGETWTNPVLNVAEFPITEFAGDVKISSDGTFLIADIGINAYVSYQGGAYGTWEKITGSNEGQLPQNSSRTEFAISPTNSNIVYAQCTNSDGSLLNVYRSDDKGQNWYVIGPGGSASFNPLGNQGTYDNVIAVYPDDEDRIILGGQYSLWSWGKTEGWNLLTYWSIDVNDLQYVHADQHALVFHPTNPDIVFCGSDGGIHRSTDGGQTWQTKNKYFNVTQFYGIAHGPNENEVLGGTQDNGSILLNPEITINTGTSHEYYEVSGGDGGYSEISQLNPNIIFSTIYYGQLFRSDEKGANDDMVSFYNTRITSTITGIGESEGGHSFITPIALWESFYDENSIDSTYKIAPRDYVTGEKVEVESNITGRYFNVTLDEDIAEDDTIWVHDTYQSQFAVGFNGSVWVTRDALSMRKEAVWVPVASIAGNVVNCMEWSADGDILYVATETGSNSNLYRIKGFNENRTNVQMDNINSEYGLTVTKIASFSSRTITGMAVDPEFGGNVVLTLGNYGSTNFVYYSTSAHVASEISSGSGSFVAKQGNLPQMPAYDAVILWSDSRKVIVGTEFGVYSTDDITDANPVWVDQNGNGFDYVPTYHFRQQIFRNGWIPEISGYSGITNHGYIYAGTHGRGIFVCKDFAGPTNVPDLTTTQKLSSVSVFPNPASESTNLNISLTEKSDVQISIFDIQGKLVDVINYKNLNSGRHSKEYNCSSMNAGVYIVRMKAGQDVKTTKLIVK
ncbi:MAG: T9SS type A sorting domain-containing protein [Bacteroidales bacterium]|nr:T9SS type A sorting domain-containing protein [Bacteroidales bacterium]